MSVSFGVRPISEYPLSRAVSGRPFEQDAPAGDVAYAGRQALVRILTADRVLALASVMCDACRELGVPNSSFCLYGGTSALAFGTSVGGLAADFPPTTDVDIKFRVPALVPREQKLRFVQIVADKLRKSQDVQRLGAALSEAGASAPTGMDDQEIDAVEMACGVLTVGSVLFLRDPGLRVVTVLAGVEQHLAEVLFEVSPPEPTRSMRVGKQKLPIRLPGYDLLMLAKIVGECDAGPSAYSRDKLHARAKRAVYLYDAMSAEAAKKQQQFDRYFWANTLAKPTDKSPMLDKFAKLLTLEQWMGTQAALELLLRDAAAACIKKTPDQELPPELWRALYQLVVQAKSGVIVPSSSIQVSADLFHDLTHADGKLFVKRRRKIMRATEASPFTRIHWVRPAWVRYWFASNWVDVMWESGALRVRRLVFDNVVGLRYTRAVRGKGSSVLYVIDQEDDDEYPQTHPGVKTPLTVEVKASDGVFQVRVDGDVIIRLPVVKENGQYIVTNAPLEDEEWVEGTLRPFSVEFQDSGNEIELFVHAAKPVYSLDRVDTPLLRHRPPSSIVVATPKVEFQATRVGDRLSMYTLELIMPAEKVDLLPAKPGQFPNVLAALEKLAAIRMADVASG